MQQLGGEKEESVEILDEKKAKVVLCSVPRFFRPETCIASSGGVFFQKPVTEYARQTSVCPVTFLTGAFYFILFQHICVISETGKQKYKA